MLFPEYVSIKLKSRTIMAALEVIMKTRGHRQSASVPILDQDESKQDVLRAARATRSPQELRTASLSKALNVSR